MLTKWVKGCRKGVWRASKAMLPILHTNPHAHLLIFASVIPSIVGITVVNHVISGVGWARFRS